MQITELEELLRKSDSEIRSIAQSLGIKIKQSDSQQDIAYKIIDEKALQRAVACWEYIKRNLIDYEHGEWFWSRYKDGTRNLEDDHAGFWKCPYHNSRMCLEAIERFR